MNSALYFLPERKEYLKLQTGTGDNDDRPYVIANVLSSVNWTLTVILNPNAWTGRCSSGTAP